MKKFALSCLALALAWVWCTGTAQATVTLTLVPSASTVALGGTLTVNATVSGTTNLGLTWSVNGMTGGNTATGTLTACTSAAPLHCTYKAPTVDVPSPNPVTFKIISAADGVTSKTATATVTDSIAVTLSPASASKALSGTQLFTATIAGTTNTALNWYVNGVLNGNATQGTLTGTGLTRTYSAPAVNVPSPNPAVVKVASAADPSKYKTASVTVTDSIVVTLSPASTIKALSGTQLFTAAISGTTNTALNWYVNGVPNGNATQGTLTGTGLTRTYTAPAINVPSPNPAVIKVASAADPSKYKTATATITTSIAVHITSPRLPPTLEVGHTASLTATVTGSTNTALTWSVNGVTHGNSTYGTISGSGLTATYTAPSLAPSVPTYAIKAASQADPSKFATLSVTISTSLACTSSGSESLLSGQYAFDLGGFNPSGFLGEVGSFAADGSGHITAGEVDSNGALGVQHSNITTSASFYSVGADHRGCATIVTPFYTFITRFNLGGITSGKATEGRMIEWETGAGAYIATGRILQQTPASFSAGPSGQYVFAQVGTQSAHRWAALGTMTFSGGVVTAGEKDWNVGGSPSHTVGVTGSYSAADSNGRFTTSMKWTGDSAAHPAAMYMLSSSQGLYLPTEPGVAFVGEARQQSGPFTNASLTGKIVTFMMGLNGGPTGGSASIALVKPNGAGSLTMTSYYDGGGTMRAPATSTCTYAVASNGRATYSGTSCGARGAVLYLYGPTQGYMLSPDTDVAIGQFGPQVTPAGGFTISSISAAFYGGTAEPVVSQHSDGELQIFTPNNGSYVGIFDDTQYDNQTQGVSETGTYKINSDGTFSVNSVLLGIVIQSQKYITFDNLADPIPTIDIYKQ